MTVLAQWLWQGLALALATAGVLRVLPRLDARARHAIWWGTLLAVLALPVVVLVSSAPVAPTAVPAAQPASAPAPAAAGAAAPLVLPAAPGWVGLVLVAAWAGSVCVGLLRIALGVHLVRRLKRTSWPMPPALSARLRVWPRLRDEGRPCEVRLSDHVGGACALGWRRPMIVVSSQLADLLGADDLDRVVAHEHAHLARRDDWTQLLQALVTALAGWHPAVWLITRRIDFEREAACDARVVACLPSRREYASCLARVGEMVVGWPPAGPLALRSEVASARRTLAARVARLLDERPVSRPGRRLTGAMLAALVLALGGSAHLGPVVAFDDVAAAVAVPAAPAPPLTASAVALPEALAPPHAVSPEPPPSARVRRARLTRQQAAGRAVLTGAASAATTPVAPDGEAARRADVEDTPAGEARAPLVQIARDLAPLPAPRLGVLEASAPAPPQAPWHARVAATGIAIGTTSKTAGASIGRFFTRAATGTARSFTNQ
jgi:beta-lactamase regulating signal transducer with metallopeptidase domain